MLVYTFAVRMQQNQEGRGGSVVEYFTRERGDAGSSLTGGTALCP